VLEEMGEGGIWAYFGCCALCANRSSSNALKGALVGTFWAASYRTYLALAHAREADPSFSLYDQVVTCVHGLFFGGGGGCD